MARAVSNEINLRTSLAAAQDAFAVAETALATSSALARNLQDSLLHPFRRQCRAKDRGVVSDQRGVDRFLTACTPPSMPPRRRGGPAVHRLPG
jgi:hypothetical protein